MGPLLFILHVNDPPEVTINLTRTHYANDTALIQLNSSDLSQLALGMKKTDDWSDKSLSLNIEKKFLFRFHKRVETKAFTYQLREITKKNKKLVRYLGILIDEKLNCKDHIQYLINKMNVFCATFYKLRIFIHKNQYFLL